MAGAQHDPDGPGNLVAIERDENASSLFRQRSTAMLTPFSLAKTLKPLLYACVGLAVATTGCSTTSKLAQSAQGSVYLEEVTDWSFEASPPAVIDQITMLKIVKGLYSDESQNGSSRMSAGGS